MSTVPLSAFLADLQAPGVSLADAEEILVEFIETRRYEGVERWKIGKELEAAPREVPAHLLSALTTAKERTLLHASFLSPAAFNIAASRAQVVNFLKTSGAQNPALSREVLLEYVAKKETVVKGWPGGVRAAVEVIQGSLRDIGVELWHLDVANSVENVQLETGYVSISGLMRFLRTLAPAATLSTGTKSTGKAAKAAADEALRKGEKALFKWSEMSLLNGAGRWELRIELNEIQSQLPVVLQPIFPPLHSSLHLPTTALCPEAHGTACILKQIVPAFQTRSDPDFVREVLMEWVMWERRRCPDVWGRKRRGEMGLKLVEMEKVVIEKLGLPHLSSVFQLVRFHCNCPPLRMPTTPDKVEAFTRLKSVAGDQRPVSAVDAADAEPLKPYNIAAILSLVPRTLSDEEVEMMVDKYVGEEKRKALEKGKGAAGQTEGEWVENDRKRVAEVLKAMIEKLNDATLTPLFVAVMERWDLPPRKHQESETPASQDSSSDDLNLAIAQGFLSPSSSVYDHESASTTPPAPDSTTPVSSAWTSPDVSTRSSPNVSPRIKASPLSRSPSSAVPIGVVRKDSPNTSSVSSTPTDSPMSDSPAQEGTPAPTVKSPPATVSESDKSTGKKRGGLFGMFGGGDKAPKPVKPPKRRPGAVPQSTSKRRSALITPSTSTDNLTLVEALKSPTASSSRVSIITPPASRPQSMHTISPSQSTANFARPVPQSATIVSVANESSSAPLALEIPKTTSPEESTDSLTPSASSGSPNTPLHPEGRRLRVLKKRSSSASTISRNSRASIANTIIEDTPALPTNALSRAEKAKADKAAKEAAKAQKRADEKAAKMAKKYPASLPSSPPVISQPFAIRSTPEVNQLRTYPSDATPQTILNAQRERRRSMVELGTFPDETMQSTKSKKRFSIFGSWTGKKDTVERTSSQRRASSHSQRVSIDEYRPTGEIIFDDTNFPPWTLPPPHMIGSPPKHNLALTPPMSPESSTIDGPWNRRNSWRMSSTYGVSMTGTSTPPIQEVAGENGSPSAGRTLQLPSNGPNYLGQQSFEESVGLGLLGTALDPARQHQPSDASTTERDARIIANGNSRHRMPSANSSFRVSNPDQPSRRPSAVSFDLGPNPPTQDSSVARKLNASQASIASAMKTERAPSVGPIGLATVAVSTSPVIPMSPPPETHSTIIAQIRDEIMLSASPVVDGLPASSLASTLAPETTPSAPVERETPAQAFTSSPLPLSVPLATEPLPGTLPPPSPSPSASSSTSETVRANISHSNSISRTSLVAPPVLSLRGVFEALPPGQSYSSGHVLDILMGFIDREREKALAFDKKRGWGDAQREKVGWFLIELEESLLPDNPHLNTTFQRVKALTDCPPQGKGKPKHRPSLSNRSRRQQSLSNIPTVPPVSRSVESDVVSLVSTSASEATDTDASYFSDSSTDSTRSDATVMLATAVSEVLSTSTGRDIASLDLDAHLDSAGRSGSPVQPSSATLVDDPSGSTRSGTPTPRVAAFPAEIADSNLDVESQEPSTPTSRKLQLLGSESLAHQTFFAAPAADTTTTFSRSRTMSGHEHLASPAVASASSTLATVLGESLPSPPMTASEAPPPYERSRASSTTSTTT